jgi:hypothetical protein
MKLNGGRGEHAQKRRWRPRSYGDREARGAADGGRKITRAGIDGMDGPLNAPNASQELGRLGTATTKKKTTSANEAAGMAGIDPDRGTAVVDGMKTGIRRPGTVEGNGVPILETPNPVDTDMTIDARLALTESRDGGHRVDIRMMTVAAALLEQAVKNAACILPCPPAVPPPMERKTLAP